MKADTFLKLEDAESKNVGVQLDKMTAYLDELDRQFNREMSEQSMQQPTIQ